MEITDIEFGRAYSQADVSGLFSKIFRFAIPGRFMPRESLTSLGMTVFGNGTAVEASENMSKPYTGYSDGVGVDWQPLGNYAIGHWGHGINSYRFCYRVCEQNRTIWLELAYGGMLEDEDKDAHKIEKYLSELDRFLEKADKAGIDVKVTDSMWNGDYRLSDADGNGVHFKESLIGSTGINGKFNRMLADFAVFIAGRTTEMPQFIDDDPGYMRWLVQNPDGWVLNAHRQPNADYLVVHRSGCRTISRPGVRYTTGSYLKRCDGDVEALSTWAMRETGNTPDMCQLCTR